MVAPETIPGPDQAKVTPPVDEPAKVVEVFAQVKTLGVPAFAVGNGFTNTDVVTEFVQPDKVFVPTTV